MKCKMQYIYLLCLFCALSSCSEDAFRSYGEGKGRLLLGGVKIEMEAQTEVVTRGSYNAPALSDLTYKVTNTQTGEVVYDQPGPLEYLILDEGSYYLEAVYGAEEIGTTPYLYGKKEFVIVRAQETALGEFPVRLNSAIVHPAMADDLLKHYEADYTLKLSDGTTTVDIANNADLYVPAGKDYTLTFSGMNKLGEMKTNVWSLNNVAASTRYTVNCNPDLPSFKLPDNVVVEGDVWSKYIYITNQMTAADMISKPEMADKVLANIVYEASSDDVNWIPAVEENGRLVIKGLTPSTNYRIRSRFGEVVSVSTTEPLMTESAQQLENGDMEKGTNTNVKSGNGSYAPNIYRYDIDSWSTRNAKTIDGCSTATNTTFGGGFCVWWRWCSGTVAVENDGGKAAEISTLALYKKAVKTGIGWSRDDVYNYTRDNGAVYVGYLFTGSYDVSADKCTLGIAHDARPKSLVFGYKYIPVSSGDNCLAYAKIYDSEKKEIASTIRFESSGQEVYVPRKELEFNYTDIYAKAAYITVFFQSGYDTNILNMHRVDGSKNSSPFGEDRVVGSVLTIDDVELVYE